MSMLSRIREQQKSLWDQGFRPDGWVSPEKKAQEAQQQAELARQQAQKAEEAARHAVAQQRAIEQELVRQHEETQRKIREHLAQSKRDIEELERRNAEISERQKQLEKVQAEHSLHNSQMEEVLRQIVEFLMKLEEELPKALIKIILLRKMDGVSSSLIVEEIKSQFKQIQGSERFAIEE